MLKFILIIDQAGKVLGACTAHPVVFKCRAILVLRGNVEHTSGVRPKQPFVARCDREIRLDDPAVKG